jgi:hypothetical protein
MAGGLAAGYRKRNLDNEGEEEKRDGEDDCNEEEASSILRKRKNRKVCILENYQIIFLY